MDNTTREKLSNILTQLQTRHDNINRCVRAAEIELERAKQEQDQVAAQIDELRDLILQSA